MESLSDNKRRTILSLLGITIGIAAVITVGTVSRSANGVVYSELESFGLTSVWINRDYRNIDPDKRRRPGTGITESQFKALKIDCCPSVLNLSPRVWSNDRVTIQNANNFSNAQLTGVDDAHLAVANDSILAGRFIRPTDINNGRRVAVLGPRPRNDLFGTSTNAVGKRIRINGEAFTVIGLLNAKSQDFLASIGSVDNDINNRVLIPYKTYLRQLGTRNINLIQAQASSLATSQQAGDEIIARLKRLTRNQFSYRKESMSGYIDTADRILGTVELVGIIAASISLLVGGMGIANMMSTSVVERTREIGLRKAIGAKSVDIRLQFLLESLIISAIGGLIGTALGLTLVSIASALTGITLIDLVPITLVAIVSAMLVGLLAGYLPARRAARLNPVTALRYE